MEASDGDDTSRVPGGAPGPHAAAGPDAAGAAASAACGSDGDDEETMRVFVLRCHPGTLLCCACPLAAQALSRVNQGSKIVLDVTGQGAGVEYRENDQQREMIFQGE